MWIVLWLVFAVVVGALAAGRGRSGFGWFLLAFLVSPLIALVILLVAGEGHGGRKRCGVCMEWVQAEAKICKHCGRDFAVSPDAWRRRAGGTAEAPARGLAALPDERPRRLFRFAPDDPPALAAQRPVASQRPVAPQRPMASQRPSPPPRPPVGGYVGLTKDGRRVDLPDGWSGGRREPKL